MELVQIHVIGLQRPQRLLQLFHDVLRIKYVRSLEVAMETVPELRSQYPVAAIPANRFADERLGQVIAVTFRGIDQVDSQIVRTV
jgi:hypothetical protein